MLNKNTLNGSAMRGHAQRVEDWFLDPHFAWTGAIPVNIMEDLEQQEGVTRQ